MTYLSTTGQPPGPPAGAPGPLGPLRMTPGRWVALAVGVPVALALIGWTGFNLVTTVARGSYPFSYAVPVHDGQVAVNINAGDVTLREAPGSSTARLTGIVQYGLFRPGISESTTPTGANVGVNCNGINRNCGMSATLDVPARTAVTLWSNGGNIAASGFSSGVTLSADGGNVTATDLTGNLQLDTGGGDLTGSGLTGALQIATEGGNVDVGNWTERAGTMRVDTGGGDLTANGLTGNVQLAHRGRQRRRQRHDLGADRLAVRRRRRHPGLQPGAEGPADHRRGRQRHGDPPAGSTKYDISTPDIEGGNVSYPSSLFSSTSTNKITIDSGGGDITISQG